MLWLCVSLPQLSVEVFQPSPEMLLAAVMRRQNRRWILACSEAAAHAGIHAGLDAVSATALVPSLQLLDQSSVREREGLRALAGWAHQFSSHVNFDTDRQLLWLEIGCSLRLFDGLEQLLAGVQKGLDELGYTAHPGVAPTPEAAALLARAKQPPILSGQAVTSAIGSLPLSLLAVPEEVIQALRASGMRRIAEVLAIPFDALGRRFGEDIPSYLHRLVGTQAEVRPAYRPPLRYRRRLELGAAIETAEGLLFPLRRLLVELQGYLRARDTGLQELKIVLAHDDKPATHLSICTTQPQRDVARLLAILRERLHSTELPEPVLEISLHVDHFVPFGDTQMDLFDSGKSNEQEWQALIDKLRARLGDAGLRKLGLNDDHRPEKAWCVVETERKQETAFPARPLWLLPTPQHLRTLPRLCGKPERIESGWWDGTEVSRDYYVAETEEGNRLWLFRDAIEQRWYLHGLWA